MVEREAVELLGGFLRAALDEPGGRGLSGWQAPGARTDRDVWISWRPLRDPAELALARWAIVTGAAILVEPGPSLHPELFAWARPTIVSGSVGELLLLADQLDSLAPRFLRRRWLRQRGERLRLLLVEGQPTALELQQVSERWRPLAPEAMIDAFRFAQRILPVAPRQGAESVGCVERSETHRQSLGITLRTKEGDDAGDDL